MLPVASPQFASRSLEDAVDQAGCYVTDDRLCRSIFDGASLYLTDASSVENGGVRRRLGREHRWLLLRPLTLGDIKRDLALELRPPARVVAATSRLRSVRSTASRSTSAVVPSLSWGVSTVVASLRPEMDRDGHHDDAHHDHCTTHEHRPTWSLQRVEDSG
jgi:hypothetical protein